jgi:tetratricopeptide (TPR) repeat protein
MGKRTYGWVSGTNIFLGPFTSDELALKFSSVEQDKISLNREGFVNTVRDLKQPLFLSLLIEFFTNETDLAVADRLTAAISNVATEDFHPHDFERIQNWWRTHENDYTNWPLSEINQGFNEANNGRYSEAAMSFQQVLKLDPSADMSRALAIGSYLEIGETNKAAELAKGFKEPTARWAQWASAKREL